VDEDAFLIDQVLPVRDADIAVHVVVEAPPRVTWVAARDLDFLTVHTPLLDAAMWVRGLPDRVTGRAVEVPPRLTLATGGLPGWFVIGTTDAREIAFGAVGRFWTPTIEWHPVDPQDFAAFAEPGWGRIACSFITVPYGPGRTMLTYECRTATTDADSRRRFLRYWWLIRPFVAHIMRATARTIAANAEDPHGIDAPE
jgi:hypothetical protein